MIDGAEPGLSVPHPRHSNCKSDWKLGLAERAFSAAGAAFLSAIIVNPLDVVKVITMHAPIYRFFFGR